MIMFCNMYSCYVDHFNICVSVSYGATVSTVLHFCSATFTEYLINRVFCPQFSLHYPIFKVRYPLHIHVCLSLYRCLSLTHIGLLLYLDLSPIYFSPIYISFGNKNLTRISFSDHVLFSSLMS